MTSSTLTYLGYGVVLASVMAWALVTARHEGWMTLPDAIAAMTQRRAVRILVVAGWVWLGWHLFVRGNAFE